MRIGIVGHSGKMGTLITKLVQTIPAYTLGKGFSRSSTYSLEEVVEDSDIIIDFSSPACTDALLSVLLEQPKPFLLGTTGFSPSHGVEERLDRLAEVSPVVICANTSLGAYAQKRVVELLSVLLDSTYDISISEVHHKEKRDGISGTALELARMISQVKQEQYGECYSWQDGDSSEKRIHMRGLRVGMIPGEHEVTFVSAQERITIRHEVFSREVFAVGVMRIVDWLRETSPKSGKYQPDCIYSRG